MSSGVATFSQALFKQAGLVGAIEAVCKVLSAYGIRALVQYQGDGRVWIEMDVAGKSERLEYRNIARIDESEVGDLCKRACDAVGCTLGGTVLDLV